MGCRGKNYHVNTSFWPKEPGKGASKAMGIGELPEERSIKGESPNSVWKPS